ncbi:Radical SAM family enzyme2C [gamma proteobacterium IMCC2047]|nr:Radical SAM family enzyme2C [gamma proteobacterium IMCC2047]
MDALLVDLRNDLEFVEGRPLASIFFGGGTPSLFSASSIGRLLEGVERDISFSKDIEITLEANPGTFEQQKFADFRRAGINRLSIGIQSFDDLQLQKLGRIHNSGEAQRAIGMAQQAGFDNFNLDLMHGLPDQSIKQALADLQTAIDFAPKHLSWYQLTIETNTEFYKQPPRLPSDDARWQIFQQGQALLAEEGFQQYEVSAYSQPGKASLHNLNYWRFGDYLGIGAGAHGKITRLSKGAGATLMRTRKTRTPKDYLNAIGAGRLIETIDQEDIAGEFMMNALRLNEGFTLDAFKQATGLPGTLLSSGIKQASAKGLLEIDELNRVKPTKNGRLFLDDLVALFI